MATTMPERADKARVGRSSEASVDAAAKKSGALTRRGAVLTLLVIAGVALTAAVAWTLSSDIGSADASLVFYTVKRADLPITVTESGSLQSQKTTEIRCDVENVGYERDGTQILTIVPNGQDVKEGELLVELDAARIQDRLDEQVLATERARSEQIQKDVRWENQQTQNTTTLAESKLKVQLDELALQQYEDEEGGTFQLELQNIDLQIQTAEAGRLIKATDLKGIETLKKLGYRSKGDLEQARLAALSADREVAKAVSSRKELVDYTYRKTKMMLEGTLASSKRSLEQVERDNTALLAEASAAKTAADRALIKEEEKLAKYTKQLEKCKIYAPHDGMATYAIERDRRSHISEGSTVRQRQRIITLPDLSVMEVKTGVHESVLDSIHKGLPASITVEAFPERKYKGSIKSVAVLADPGEWHSSDVKVYTTIVTIDEDVHRLRPGMSAIVDIHVERVKDVLSVPVQAVVQINRDNWCYVGVNREVEIRKVTIGKTNEKFVEIREGLEEGDRVVLNPMSLVEDSQEPGQEINPENGDDAATDYDKPTSDAPAEKGKPTEKDKPTGKGKAAAKDKPATKAKPATKPPSKSKPAAKGKDAE